MRHEDPGSRVPHPGDIHRAGVGKSFSDTGDAMRNVYTLFTIACFALTTAAASSQQGPAGDRPHFTTESLPAFRAAFTGRTGAALDRVHDDATRYRAFRFVQRGAVTVGIAKAITVDSSGLIHILGEPGTTTYGRSTTKTEYSHILVPVGVRRRPALGANVYRPCYSLRE